MYKILREIAKSEDNYKRIQNNLSDGVLLYGAGFIGQWSVQYLESQKIKIKGFIDSNKKKWGKSYKNKLIFSPRDQLVQKAKIIIITSRHAVNEIKKSLHFLQAELISIDAFVIHNTSHEEIIKIESLLSHDIKSIETYHGIIKSMLSGLKGHLSKFSNNFPFFNEFGFFNRDGEIFVDAGAYVGDSLERFIWSVNGVFNHIYAFEPGKLQFDALDYRVKRLIKEWALDSNSISLINKGLSSKKGVTEIIENDNLIQTRLNNEYKSNKDNITETKKIKKISLDEYFKEEKFTFLKVDVEGSEQELIIGSTKSIKTHRPKIALSIYHFPTDIFSLPILCNSINNQYIFTMRHHSSQLMDTVLYCKDKNE
jgi:FkbM family methyltransferase